MGDDDEEQKDINGNREELLVGAAWSTRVTRQTTIPNIQTSTVASYGTALNQVDHQPSLDYDSLEAKVITMIMMEFNK
jgi:hypothetical protein